MLRARYALPAAGALYAYDRFYCYSVAARSARAVGTGLYLTWQYKIIWTPETAAEVHARVARRLVDTCKKNEGLYVKFGQVLASMAFALPREYHEPLGELHDRAKTFSLAEVKRIVSREIGDLPLTDFEDSPIASASLAQVHRARLNGKLVAVKIQKPNVAVQADWDLRLYALLLRVLEFSFDLPLAWTFDFTRTQLLGEVDFRSEAEHSDRAVAEFRNSPLRDRIYVPEIFAASKRVLVSEWVDGAFKITDKAEMTAAGLDARGAVADAVSAFAYQIFHLGHVHCDPHPGNLLVRQKPGGAPGEHQVVLIDHGLYVELTDELRLDYARFWVAMTPPQNKEILKEICSKWGIKDFELYATVTSFKQGGRSAEDFINKEGQNKSKAELQAMMKDRVKTALNDTSLFPRPLLFVGRCQNYIRATNWAHGNPVDRFAVMMEYARDGLAAAEPPKTFFESLRYTYVSWLISLARVFTYNSQP